MAATYPTGVKTWVSLIDGTDYPQASDINTLYEEVTAIEIELGTSPSGSFATVKARFDNYDTVLTSYISGPTAVPVIDDAGATATTKLWSSDKIDSFVRDRVDINTTNDNLWAGDGAGDGLSSGTDNTLLGNTAGNAVSSGTDNTLIGSEAGLVLTGADFNTMIGSEAGKASSSAASSVLIGYQAGLAITTGGENVIIGAQAADTMSTGVRNVIIGRSAGTALTTGSDRNIIIGYQALNIATTDDDCIVIGTSALGASNGNDKIVAIGNSSGDSMDNSEGIFIGHQAGSGLDYNGAFAIATDNTSEPPIWGDLVNKNIAIHNNLIIGGDPTSDTPSGTHVLVLKESAGTNHVASCAILYAQDVAGTVEMIAEDEDGNQSQLTPHDFELFDPDDSEVYPWSYSAVNNFLGKKINVDMAGAIRAIEQLSGKQFIYYKDIDKTDVTASKRDQWKKKYKHNTCEEIEVTEERYKDRKKNNEKIRKDKKTGKFIWKKFPTDQEVEQAANKDFKLEVAPWLRKRLNLN